jgi:hypothetical protein
VPQGNNLQVNNGGKDCHSQYQNQPFKIVARQKTREVQNQNNNGYDVEQGE